MSTQLRLSSCDSAAALRSPLATLPPPSLRQLGARVLCAKGNKAEMAPKHIRLAQNPMGVSSATLRSDKDLQQLLNVLGAGGGALLSSNGRAVLSCRDLQDEEEYTPLPPSVVEPSVSNVQLTLPTLDGPVVRTFAELTQAGLVRVLNLYRADGLSTAASASAGATIQLLTEVSELQPGHKYAVIRSKLPTLSTRIETLEGPEQSRLAGQEDAMAGALHAYATAQHPNAVVQRLSTKKYKDAAGKEDVVELDAGTVVRDQGEVLLYCADHKQKISIDIGRVVDAKIKLIRDAWHKSPELAAELQGVNKMKFFIAYDAIDAETPRGTTAIVEEVRAAGAALLGRNGNKYSVLPWAKDIAALAMP